MPCTKGIAAAKKGKLSVEPNGSLIITKYFKNEIQATV